MPDSRQNPGSPTPDSLLVMRQGDAMTTAEADAILASAENPIIKMVTDAQQVRALSSFF